MRKFVKRKVCIFIDFSAQKRNIKKILKDVCFKRPFLLPKSKRKFFQILTNKNVIMSKRLMFFGRNRLYKFGKIVKNLPFQRRDQKPVSFIERFHAFSTYLRRSLRYVAYHSNVFSGMNVAAP